MLHVERSNRTERLLEGLADRLIAPGRDPLTPATVVVQGPGMERWIAQQVARRHGVCANVEFLFPRAFLERAFESVLAGLDAGVGGDPEAAKAWEPSRLAWSIARALGALADEAEFAAVARHLDRDDGEWRRVQLAARLAALFDQYLDYRPEWMIEWSGDGPLPDAPEIRWQARLVRHLAETLGADHFANRAHAFARAVASPRAGLVADAIAERFPEPVEIFAVSMLPPVHLESVASIARLRPVQLSILSPSRSYWGELWRELRDESSTPAQDAATDLFSAGAIPPAGRLLAGLGRLGADLHRRLEDLAEVVEQDEDLHVSPRDTAGDRPLRLLEQLQADMLDLDETAARDPSERAVIADDDDSLTVHVCHGPRRELEVVFSTLRAALDDDPTLRPEDVIVMAPAIDEIAAGVESVFGSRVDGPLGIPYRIADRGALRRSPVAEAFGALLGLLTERTTRGELLDWLSRPPARERFGLDEEAVERLGDWAESAGIRFGVDGDHRADLGLAPEVRRTWQGGLARLALAHAVGSDGEACAGLAPVALDAFSDPAVLGALGDLEELLAEARRTIAEPRPVAEWCAWLDELREKSCAQDDRNAHEHARLRELLRSFATDARIAGFGTAIPFEAIREQLATRLEATPPPQAFLAGGVTFCELVPLRAIPFRIVVLVGLADDAFPRGRPAPQFDRIAAEPRPGDRSPRHDDRALFLEALLSARDRLVITVPGRDLRDGSERPPSVVVSELLDTIAASHRVPERPSETRDDAAGDPIRERLVVAHPLQSSSLRCFDVEGDPRLRGRDPEEYAGAEARRAAAIGEPVQRRFLDLDERPLEPAPRESPLVVELETVVARLAHATRAFVRDRLGVRLPRPEESADELDPLEFGPLDRWALGTALLDDLAAGRSIDDALTRVAARPSAPVGPGARPGLVSLRDEVVRIWRIAEARRGGAPVEAAPFEIDLTLERIGAVRLVGRFDRLFTGGRVEVVFSRRGPRHELGVWIRHLALCAAVEAGLAATPRSCLVGRPPASPSNEKACFVAGFDPVERPLEPLAPLVERALALDDAPLPLFPKSSWRFVLHEDDEARAWREANQAYHGGDTSDRVRPEEAEGLEHALLWAGRSPIDPTHAVPPAPPFDVLARDVFLPLNRGRTVSEA